jgi:hypothetical protein
MCVYGYVSAKAVRTHERRMALPAKGKHKKRADCHPPLQFSYSTSYVIRSDIPGAGFLLFCQMGKSASFMVFPVLQHTKRAVDLFQQHNPRQLMR